MNESDKETSAQHDAEQTATTAANDDQAAADGQFDQETPEQARDRLEGELAEMRDRFLRTMADVENARSRHQRELEDARKFASTAFAKDLLEVVDNLGRALATVPNEARQDVKILDDLMTGVELTERTLLSAFGKHKIEKVVPEKGSKFDHKLHQAMFEVPTSELPPGCIADVMQVGYTIAGRLLRPAMVGVTKAAPQPQTDAAAGSDPSVPGAKVDTSA